MAKALCIDNLKKPKLKKKMELIIKTFNFFAVSVLRLTIEWVTGGGI